MNMMPPITMPRLHAAIGRARRVASLLVIFIFASTLARAQDEVPFVTTPDAVTVAMLQLAGVGPADHVIDLGSGDGRIVITAAKRFGAGGLGVEISPELVRASQRNAQAAGVQSRVEFRQQDLFEADLARGTVITMYLLPDVNLQLRPRLLALAAGTRIVSHDWDLGDWQPERTLTLDVPDKPIGLEKRSRVHLWVVPAAVQGEWCGTNGLRLLLSQRFQFFSATLQRGRETAPLLVIDGRIDGRTLSGRSPDGATPTWLLTPAGLRMSAASGAAAGYAGSLFTPAGIAGCR